MKKIIFCLICFISILVVRATIINDRLLFKDSYGTEFYGNSTPLRKTFEDVSVINWSARSYMNGGTIYVSFRLSGAETGSETFTLLNQYSFKSGSIGNVNSLSTYNLNGDVTCNNLPYDGASGAISFEAFIAGLN